LKVIAGGSISVYESEGAYQLYVKEIHPLGQGELFLAYEQLKEKLLREGLFAPEIKRDIPFMPRKIGIVTSPTGAVIRDIITIIKRRFPGVELIISPTAVNGISAAPSIIAALERIFSTDVDLIIVARGGGSFEDLFCFNNEFLVRKIRQSPVPLISAVGHETDYTLSDFAADYRAATPSMAAEVAVPVLTDLEENLLAFQRKMLYQISNKIANEIKVLERLKKSIPLIIIRMIREEKSRIIFVKKALNKLSIQKMITERKKYRSIISLLNSLSPLNVLERGYSLCRKDLIIVNSIKKVSFADQITVVVKDGEIDCLVEKIREGR
jgi:exodeoxyribonuclease VII large subunit